MTQAKHNGPEHIASCFVPCERRLDAPWFCVWTTPNGETLADHSLRSAGFPSFLPLYVHRWANRQTRISPLFPRYMFAQPNDEGWSGMLRQRGVADVLRRDGRPIEVPPRHMDRLFRQCAPNGVIYPASVKLNEPARVIRGSMTDFVGICTKTEADRVSLLMEILGRPVEMEFARSAVVAEKRHFSEQEV